MRVLIFSSDIGEGHELPARVVCDGILARRPDAEVLVLDTMRAAGPVATLVVRRGAEVVLGRLGWLFDLQYWLIARFAPTRALMRRLCALIALPGLLRTVAAFAPDVIVCTYPGANELLSDARRRGRLAVPVVSAITDLAALQYWAHAGCDLHLVVHPESAAEIRAIAGAAARVVAVRGLTSPGFEAPVDPAGARAALGLDGGAPVVLVSGGGWGIGDLEGAVRAALAADPAAQVVALCGHNAPARTALQAAFAREPRVRVSGFTDRMDRHLAAADVLVHSTAGLTALEAMVCGARVISYGWGRGHVRLNNEAYARFGLADVVEGPAGLSAAIARALLRPRSPDVGYARRPAAADEILDLAGA
ncbi:MGDG synthase family glycosyltransferase [Baekduia soli]|uniref:MGDG synthase family glycosyltransferase n=1 Tax=Baekduia soli TaxID=496014 RepID=UPI001652023D|nr:glycosyltransferase [Baekduia soli]